MWVSLTGFPGLVVVHVQSPSFSTVTASVPVSLKREKSIAVLLRRSTQGRVGSPVRIRLRRRVILLPPAIASEAAKRPPFLGPVLHVPLPLKPLPALAACQPHSTRAIRLGARTRAVARRVALRVGGRQVPLKRRSASEALVGAHASIIASSPKKPVTSPRFPRRCPSGASRRAAASAASAPSAASRGCGWWRRRENRYPSRLAMPDAPSEVERPAIVIRLA